MLNRFFIEKYLEEINEELKALGQEGSLIIAGGAALALAHDARRTTMDVDGIFAPSEAFHSIIQSIAERHDLPKDWLNNGVKGFITEAMDFDLFRSYSHLNVYLINDAPLLAMKLTSARVLSSDPDDCMVLMENLNIKTIDELYEIVDKYALPSQKTAQSHFFIQEVFDRYESECLNCSYGGQSL